MKAERLLELLSGYILGSELPSVKQYSQRLLDLRRNQYITVDRDQEVSYEMLEEFVYFFSHVANLEWQRVTVQLDYNKRIADVLKECDVLLRNLVKEDAPIREDIYQCINIEEIATRENRDRDWLWENTDEAFYELILKFMELTIKEAMK